MKISRALLLSIMLAHLVLAQSVTPYPVAAFLENGSAWIPWASAGSFGYASETPYSVGLFCQASTGGQWSPCQPIVNGSSPSFAAITGSGSVPTSCIPNTTYAGIGATCTLTTGSTNLDMEITLTTGTGTAIGGPLAVITFSTAFAAQPFDCSPKPHNTNAVGQVLMVYAARPTTATCTISVAGSAVPASTALIYGVHVE